MPPCHNVRMDTTPHHIDRDAVTAPTLAFHYARERDLVRQRDEAHADRMWHIAKGNPRAAREARIREHAAIRRLECHRGITS